MISIILSIGDELALGQTVDTNSAWMSQQLAAVGCDIAAHKTVADDRAAIARTIAEEAARCDLLLISGGLGPTEDDLTRDALADVLQVPLEPHAESMKQLEAFFARLTRPMPERNRVQAMLPRGSQPISNPNGTAPGIRLEIPRERVEGGGVRREGNELTPHASTLNPCQIFVMPGVPKEMKPMFINFVLPWVKERSGGAVILQKTLHTFGIGESRVGEMLGGLMMRQRNPSVGTTVANGLVSCRVNARFPSLAEAEAAMKETVAACYAALGDSIFGEDGRSIPQVVAALLMEKKATVSTAESCTGGLIAKMLTDLPGSSAYFHRGWITYSNAAKADELGVKEETLKAHGAVSEATVLEMAAGARTRAGSDYALSISGIAGPDGGTADKPVGTVWIALAAPTSVTAQKYIIPGDREHVRDRAAKTALWMLRYALLGKRMPT
ncbi:MAG TPA: competence/damage-inducible protein A [Tepidisphaeraceae bacterium]